MKNKPTVYTLCIFFFFFNYSIAYADKTEDNGTILQVAIPAAALFSTMVYEKGDHHEGTKQFAKALATTLVTTGALKAITHKKRPDNSSYDSFPSGHTSAAFMGASFIHKRYGLKAAIIPYIGATYVGYSRVHAKRHDTVDVVAGAALGIFSSRYFTSSYNKLNVAPVITDDSVSIELSKQW